MGTQARQARDTATALTVLSLVAHDLTQLYEPLQDDDWDRRTPCAEWCLRDLTEHITGGNRFTISILCGETSEAVLSSARRSFTGTMTLDGAW